MRSRNIEFKRAVVGMRRLGLPGLFVLLLLPRPGWCQQRVTWVWVQNETSRLKMDEVLKNLNEPVPEFGNAKTTEEYLLQWNLPIHIDDSSAEDYRVSSKDFQVKPTHGQTKYEFLSKLELGGSICIRNQEVKLSWGQNATLCVYDVTCLGRNGTRSTVRTTDTDFAAVVNLLERYIDANWEVDGGTDGAYPWAYANHSFLVIRAPLRTHLQIQSLFRALGLVESNNREPSQEKVARSTRVRRSLLSK